VETGDLLLIAALVLVGGALLWGVFLRRTGRSRRSPASMLGIPAALRPGQPDEVLEGSRLERLLAAGFVATLAAALFIPLYWLPEKQRQESFTERFSHQSVERGELIFKVAPRLEEDADPLEFKELEHAVALGMGCANCHGGVARDPETDELIPEDTAGGGFASPPGRDPVTGKIVAWVAPPLNTVFQRWDEEVVRFTIERGRPGTPMPTWGQEYGGPMTTQMVDDVMAFLKEVQVTERPDSGSIPGENYELEGTEVDGQEIFEARCAVCHGPQGEGKENTRPVDIPVGNDPEEFPRGPIYYPGLALWNGDVGHLSPNIHHYTIRNGRRFAFMPPFAEAPSQGIPVPPHPLTDEQIEAVMEYERTL
jgi:mono/diheme cytochrome c family protein